MIIDLRLIDYQEAYRIQKELVKRRRFGEIEDSAIILEHPPIFTIGRAGSEENLLISKDILKDGGVKVVRVDRGGDITFHGPGQVVLYPIVDLNNRGRDLHKYLRALEEVVINFLKEYSIFGERIEERTGVWVGGRKISSIGIGVSNWITYHGLSVNINVDLKFFSMIRPCGLRNVRITSLSEILNREVPIAEAKPKLLAHFTKTFSSEKIDATTYHAALA